MLKKKNNRIETIIGNNTSFKGEVEVKGILRVDGNFEGTIRAEWVIIGPEGSVKGDIQAKGIVVGGKVEGNLSAEETVEIESKGQVIGDISTKKLTIIEGGLFEGKSIMRKNGANVVEMVKG
ncbi:MAG: polymer-forming cytoskeletal protein [Nitrospirae bacterium]|nr:polymer-forming cytoskeletal protein [Nitrospirota bacterium]